MRKVLLNSLFILTTVIFVQAAKAETQVVFTVDQEAVISDVAAEFSVAMGSAAIDPQTNCIGLREHLRSKIIELQPILEVASKLPTDIFSDSNSARNVLDAELALQYVDKTCAAHGV